jgi:hypothetical protein
VPVVYGGIAALAGLLLAVGYLAGRAAPGRAAGESPAGSVGQPLPDAPAVATPSSSPAPFAAAAAEAAMPGRPTGVTAPAYSPAAAAPGVVTAPLALRRDVAEYFRRMDASQSAAVTWSDPTALAQEILAQAMRGDSGGFDKLIAASTGARDGVRTMTVPPPCGEHHRLTLVLLDESVVLLTKLREQLVAGDAGAIAGIASTGSDLEARARAVEALGASLRTQYGVEAAR